MFDWLIKWIHRDCVQRGVGTNPRVLRSRIGNLENAIAAHLSRSFTKKRRTKIYQLKSELKLCRAQLEKLEIL